MNALETHFMKYLTLSDRHWHGPDVGEGSVNVLSFYDQVQGFHVMVSDGLRSLHLYDSDHDGFMCMELMTLTERPSERADLAAVMCELVAQVAKEGRPMLDGALVINVGRIVKRSRCRGFLAYTPVLYEDDFCVFEDDGHMVNVVWLVPLTAKEIRYVKKHGYEQFVDILVEKDPNLWDLRRRSVV